MKGYVFLALIAMLLLVGGCQRGSKLVGKWEPTGQMAEMMPSVITMQADGTYLIESTLAQAGNMRIVGTGRYREEGERVHITISEVNFENVPPELKQVEAQMRQSLTQHIKVGQEETHTITWQDNDTYTTVDPQGRSQTYKRIQ
jgi:predicted SpoU family rRNA methylase